MSKNITVRIFTAALLIVTNNWKQRKFPTGEQIYGM